MTRSITADLPKYTNSRKMEVQNQVTADIMKLIERRHNDWKFHYDIIAKQFWQGNVKDTARAIFDFLKNNVEYVIEPGAAQTVKTPAAILKQGRGDCKHYASFTVGIADALNRMGYPIEGSYKFVNGNNNTANYHHVFAVVTDQETGNEYNVDPIDDKVFNQRDRYIKTKIIPMALYTVSGEIGKKAKVTKAQKKANKQANKEARKANAAARKAERKELRKLPAPQRRAVKKERRQEKRAVNKEIRKGATGVQKTSHVVMKVPNAASRGSFLALLKINAFRMASKIAAKAAKDPEWLKQLQVQWHAAGGTWQPLKQAVNQGVNVWNAKRADKVQAIGANESGWVEMPYIYQGYPWQEPLCNCNDLDQAQANADMGMDPYTWASIAAIVAAAVPLIMKLSNLLKKADVNTDELNEQSMDATEEVIDQYNDYQEYPVEEDEEIPFGKSNAPQYGMRAYNDPKDGRATIEYTKSNINENGDIDYTGSNLDLNMFFERAKGWVSENKTPLLVVGGGILAIKFLPDILNSFKSKKRRR